MKTILVTPRGYAKYGQEERKRLEELGYTMDINDTGKPVPRDVFVAKAKEATGIIVGVDELDGDLIRECKNLKAIVKFGIGVDNIDLPVCEEKGVKVGRCVGTNSNAVAELTIGMMFACARDLVSNAMEVMAAGPNLPVLNYLARRSVFWDLEISENMWQEWHMVLE
jgi:lactate dehydrogenase-like 2-hydroxyacid dehydrogenase